MDECNYLKHRGVLTLNDFEKYLSSVSEKVDASKSSMSEKELCLKELQQLMDEAKTYEELKPVINELKKINIVLPKRRRLTKRGMTANFADFTL